MRTEREREREHMRACVIGPYDEGNGYNKNGAIEIHPTGYHGVG